MKQKVLLAIMDGVGERESSFGNAVKLAKTPNLDWLKKNALYRTIYAHGTYVGMPSDSDLGNSEVGHNAMGAGRVFDQGATLVKQALESRAVFSGLTWLRMIEQLKSNPSSTLHFIGLLSDGNVHAHEEHLYCLIREAKAAGVRRVRVHPLLDGRDVGETSAEIYAARLEAVIASLASPSFDIAVASGGGRMNVTMDRYEADWSIVERGWRAHVLGDAADKFSSLSLAIAHFRTLGLTDQYFPPFVIVDSTGETNKIVDGDAVVLFNFRGDRAIEISRAFTEESFPYFDRIRFPKVYFAGMTQYDGDLKIPEHYLVSPPEIGDTFGEYLAGLKVRQFACSETQKFGHVTFFWNGNRSGKFNEALETYVEVPSDRIQFDQKPEMKAVEIVDITITAMNNDAFDFGRINLANGDMVGHTGSLPAAVSAVETVDAQIGRLRAACEQKNTILIVTADHGNCEEMFDAKASDFPDWSIEAERQPKPKTSHTLNQVPFYVFVPKGCKSSFVMKAEIDKAGLANIANTVLVLLGLKERSIYLPSMIREN